MTQEEHFRRLESMYKAAPIQDIYNGTTLEVSEEEAIITLPISPSFFHAAQAVHGSVYFRLMDDAAYFAVASLVRDVFIVTTTFTTHLVRPVTGGSLKAVGKVRTKGKTIFTAEATVYNEKGKEVAFGTGQFTKTNQKLETLEGYKQ
ncbi:PaaI family thioesterase [Pontibacter harenae]|uniref:PaaI family thioesterase n=1 Tax=Pontibacter harenae TaxID=2894083 RepID=UPI001E5E8C96|nr:PaaI family thioesterase [Pontibacter harenae]MCC9166313.1 PaaI family thioesterase [Pontibacter harenae]